MNGDTLHEWEDQLMTTPTLDQVLTLATQLSIRDQARLVAQLTPHIAQALDQGVEPPPAPRSSLQAILHALQRADPWVGDDLDDRLAAVYATRSQVEAV